MNITQPTRLLTGLLFLGLTVGAVHAQDSGGGTGGSSGGASPAENATLGATAELIDAEGNVVGDANFTTSEEGYVTIQVGLSSDAGIAPGEHGFHIHETGECSAPDFESAGSHFNPTDAQHGLLNPEGPHIGDLPNLVVAQDGTVDYVVTTALVTLDDAERSLFDDDGSAVMIHEGADDYVTDSSGNSGGRLVCGVVEQP